STRLAAGFVTAQSSAAYRSVTVCVCTTPSAVRESTTSTLPVLTASAPAGTSVLALAPGATSPRSRSPNGVRTTTCVASDASLRTPTLSTTPPGAHCAVTVGVTDQSGWYGGPRALPGAA